MGQTTVQVLYAVLYWWLHMANTLRKMRIMICVIVALHRRRLQSRPTIRYSIDFQQKRIHLRNMVYSTDNICYNQIRIYRLTFDRLCSMLDNIEGLKPSKNMLVDEQVAMFLHIIAYDVKNRVIQYEFGRSGETISRYFQLVLKAMMRLHGELFKIPEPVDENLSDNRWKWFKNYLGALDGTHIPIKVPAEQKAKYRNRKRVISTNVLGVCSPDGEFTYVFLGWERSAEDDRVLRDAISKVNGGLKVPHGFYDLVDTGYTNCEGFLALYRGQRYHLNEWREEHQPNTAQEHFNMKHSSARNIIERCFGILKNRWAILRHPSFYPIRTHNRVIMACCMLHNLCKRYNRDDPLHDVEAEYENENYFEEDNQILTMETFYAWSNWRDLVANKMFNDFTRV